MEAESFALAADASLCKRCWCMPELEGQGQAGGRHVRCPLESDDGDSCELTLSLVFILLLVKYSCALHTVSVDCI